MATITQEYEIQTKAKLTFNFIGRGDALEWRGCITKPNSQLPELKEINFT